jgi:hypothetical protein
MSKIESPFRPIGDSTYFPLLSGNNELPCAHLMGCEGLVCMAPVVLPAVPPVIGRNGVEWHLYGDTRWPASSVWIEFCTSPGGYRGRSGVLVMHTKIPANPPDAIDWAARNNPLRQLFPHERSEEAIQQRLQMLRYQAASAEETPGPSDTQPRFIQSYCIYREEETTVRLVACYTDLLNAGGIPIQKYRMVGFQPDDVGFCRFALHSLFALNRARLDGMKFMAFPQLQACEPAFLPPDQKEPRWAQFHPSRVLRTRPALRTMPTPDNMVNGIMHLEDFERTLEARRLEANRHMLAYELGARPRTGINEDTNACMAAFTHRANGGAIYVLPDRLVEEFDYTDCGEVRMSDIKLPFQTLFLKFTPPEPLYLAEGAPVDGCYIAKQGAEYLFILTSHWEGVDYTRSLSVACLDPTFSLHLPCPEFSLEDTKTETELCVMAAVEKGIEQFLAENAPPTDNISQTITRPDGTRAEIVDVRAESRKRRIEILRSQEPVFRACLNIIVNAACFISFRPEDITDDWEGEPPAWVIEALQDTNETRRARDRKRDAFRSIATGDYTRIKVCGKNLFTYLQIEDGATAHGVSPRAHWRRGHWRRQRYGVGLSLVTPRWIRPTIVKKENGPLVETRIYDVHHPPPESDEDKPQDEGGK